MGSKAEFVFGSSKIPVLPLSIVSYAQSDINLDGRAYGLQMGLTPYNARGHINSGYDANGAKDYNIVIKPMLDDFHIDDASASALTAGESYAWLGGEFGAQVLANPVLGNGMTASIRADAYRDLNSGQEAVDGYARLDVFVNPERTAAFRVEYRDMEPRTTLIERGAVTGRARAGLLTGPRAVPAGGIHTDTGQLGSVWRAARRIACWWFGRSVPQPTSAGCPWSRAG